MVIEMRKRSVIDISSSSEEEEESSEESESFSESDEDISSSDRDSDGEEEEEEELSSSGSEEHDADDDDDEDEDIDEESTESGCDTVHRLLQGGGELRKIKAQLRKLRLMDCKAYLRSNELRLSGTKEECIQRIIEHWRMKDGNGQRLYPRSSFTINCTGDVCKGDVVLFKQKVYKNFDKIKRGGEQLGKRTVAGRIVKESYGAAKQQHTFTVEVLWSQGVKKLPPLYPLLVKGRNLYKMKTFRQRWKNEDERLEVLAEKHKRGDAARYIRATRKSKLITKPTNASSKNKGNKRQKIDHHRKPSDMVQTSKGKKHNCSSDERGKVKVGSKRTQHHHRKPRPLGRLNSETRNGRAAMRHPNFVPAIRETSLQFYPSSNNLRHFESDDGRAPMRHPNFVPAIRETSLQFYPSANNLHHFESDVYSQRVPCSSSWPRPHLSSSSSYALPAREHQQYDRGNYPNVSYPRYVSQSSNLAPFSDMADTQRLSGSFPFVSHERRWNF